MTELEIKNLKKLDTDITEIMAKTMKLNKEIYWYPVVIVGGIFVAVGAFFKILGLLN